MKCAKDDMIAEIKMMRYIYRVDMIYEANQADKPKKWKNGEVMESCCHLQYASLGVQFIQIRISLEYQMNNNIHQPISIACEQLL